MAALKSFLREHWMWIAGSALLVVVALVLIMVLGAGKSTSPFQYSEF